MIKHKGLRFVAMLICAITLLSMLCTVAMAAYRTIPFGEESDEVRKMQNALKQKGYYKGAIDGKFGPSTKKAIISYQNAIGIHADGRPGNKTLTALYHGKKAINDTRNSALLVQAKASNTHSLAYGHTGSRVRALQQALKKAGCYSGTIDGVYGDLTYAAVKKYQSKNGLRVDGIAGSATIASLNKKTNVTIRTTFLLDVGSTGPEVKKVTAFLTGKGYLTAGTEYYTATVKAAVKAWQQKNGKPVTGSISESQYNRIILGQENNTK